MTNGPSSQHTTQHPHRLLATRISSGSDGSIIQRIRIRHSNYFFSSVARQPSNEETTTTTTISNSNTTSISNSLEEGIPSDIAPLVVKLSRKDPTPASLQMLLQTGRGRGEFGSGGYLPLITKKGSNNKKSGTASSTGAGTTGVNNWGGRRRLGHQRGRLAGEQRILLHMAGFLRHELPVRLAHRILDLDQVPLLRDMEAVQQVKGIYINSFRELTAFTETIQTAADEAAFAQLLTTLYQKHAGVLVQMARGAYQLREQIRQQEQEKRRIAMLLKEQHHQHPAQRGGGGNPWNDGVPAITTTTSQSLFPSSATTEATDEELAFERMIGCHRFLDRFYMSRIGIRFLAGQYLSLRRESNTSSINDPQQLSRNHPAAQQDYIGMICSTTSPHDCVRQATADASMMCRRTYGRCPPVQVSGRLDLTFSFIPAYLHYILLELLKNALRATMDRHLHGDCLPPVEVVIADGMDNEDVVIKISDEGGGIPRSQVDKIWSYLFTTADKKVQQSFIGGNAGDDDDHMNRKDHSSESPLAGLGYGLPISRSYCRYFGGDLDLISMEGYGTDAFVHLKRLGDSKEPVPV